jgi:hypothetical protein
MVAILVLLNTTYARYWQLHTNGIAFAVELALPNYNHSTDPGCID